MRIIFLFFFIIILFIYIFFFINNQRKHSKMIIKYNIRSYSYQVIKQYYRINGVRVTTVIDNAKRAASVDRDWLPIGPNPNRCRPLRGWNTRPEKERRGRPNRHHSIPAPRERGLIQPFFR